MNIAHSAFQQGKKAQRDKFLGDLERTFQEALKNKNFPSAVKAKELQARELGLLTPTEKSQKLSLESLSKKDLQQLLKEIEDHPFQHLQGIEVFKKEIKNLKNLIRERGSLKQK